MNVLSSEATAFKYINDFPSEVCYIDAAKQKYNPNISEIAE